MYTYVHSAAAAELTLREVIADLPTDAGAVVVLLMLGCFLFLTWYGSRESTVKKYPPAPPPPILSDEPSDPAAARVSFSGTEDGEPRRSREIFTSGDGTAAEAEGDVSPTRAHPLTKGGARRRPAHASTGD